MLKAIGSRSRQTRAPVILSYGYERMASPGYSDRTNGRRVHAWAAPGLMERVHTLALDAYGRGLGLDLDDPVDLVAVDGCLTKAPRGRKAAGRTIAGPHERFTGPTLSHRNP